MSNDAMAHFRKDWAASTLRFTPADYRCGYPLPDGNGNWAIKPWGEKTDIGPFAETAAIEMMHVDPDIFPADICSFAIYLRQVYILESLNLPVDPHGINVVRLVEALIFKENNTMPCAEAVKKRIVSMLENLAEQITIEGQKEEAEAFRSWCLDRISEGKDPFANQSAIQQAFPGLTIKKGGKLVEGEKA